MFHAILFALLSAFLLLFAFESSRAGLLVVAVPAALLAAWMADSAFRSGRGALRRGRAARNGQQ